MPLLFRKLIRSLNVSLNFFFRRNKSLVHYQIFLVGQNRGIVNTDGLNSTNRDKTTALQPSDRQRDREKETTTNAISFFYCFFFFFLFPVVLPPLLSSSLSPYSILISRQWIDNRKKRSIKRPFFQVSGLFEKKYLKQLF